MPPNTPVPIALRAPEPAPLLSINGVTPRPNASDVIRIGRNRMRVASRVASSRARPWSSRSLANSAIRIAFFADRPMVVSSPTWKNTSFSSPRRVAPSTAPIMPSGTTSITANGIDQLS